MQTTSPPHTSPTAVHQIVRPMQLTDIPQVMEVEQQSFPTMWPPTAFKREIQQNRLARYLVAVQRRGDAPPRDDSNGHHTSNGLQRLLGGLRQMWDTDDTSPEEREELVVGFIGVWMLADEAHVVTIAVRDSHRRRGIGELLLIAAVETALRERQAVVTLECRVSNTVAIRLYEKYGFQQVGLRPHYYSDNQEDAYILTAEAITTEAYRQRFEELRGQHRHRWGGYRLDL
ncbi:MAG: ribosomal protein S18-alanine N-acetyltransferase [Dehalococcoidia bacterium]